MAKPISIMTDAEFAAFNTNFRTLVTPSPGAWGLSAPELAVYGAVADIWEEKYPIAITPSTRTSSAVEGKNKARKDLEVQAAALIKKINGTLSVTNEQRILLNLHIPKQPEPIQPPDVAPLLIVTDNNGWTIGLKVMQADGETRAKPYGVDGARVFSYIGPEPVPADITKWQWQGSTTDNRCIVTFPLSVPEFTKVWFVSCWFSPRQAAGPLSTPIFTHIGTGVSANNAA